MLLSFDNEQILMWRGKDWKSDISEDPSATLPSQARTNDGLCSTG